MPKIKRPSAAQIQTLVDEYGAMRAADIIGVTYQTLLNWRNAMGMEVGPALNGRKPRPPEAQMREMYAKHGLRHIAHHYGVSLSTAWRWVKHYGIQTRTAGERIQR